MILVLLDTYIRLTGITMSSSDLTSLVDEKPPQSTTHKTAAQCIQERELAHAYAVQLSLTREELVAQREQCSSRMRDFRASLSALDTNLGCEHTRLPGWPQGDSVPLTTVTLPSSHEMGMHSYVFIDACDHGRDGLYSLFSIESERLRL